MARRPYPPITADFPGAAYPVGSGVRFAHGDGTIAGTVAILKRHQALVHTGQGRWNVPYGLLELVEQSRVGNCSLAEIEALANKLLKHHRANSGLGKNWRFGFDLAPSRAGVCKYDERRIDLSVSFCLRASRTELIDTILHEIAHAIVGKAHNHDAVWATKAREIGCTGERTHAVRHTAARWAGECGCGQRWFRQRLSRKVANGARCPRCQGEIRWRRHDGELDTVPPG
ncbi:MAG: SprT-like domain-containing protein [Gammaproteobacteria bacterium]|nr:SprT-like domain-containing protein [Gammaproteobacteria bacterium]MDE0272133.1 SprT-like domain-containing protein [Gammaproteobacteria bacterium]